MKKLIFLFLLSTKLVAQPPPPDYSTSFIESSKSWVDVDYVGDGIIGHKLDVFLPKTGKAPFPVVIAIYGSAWFSNSSKSSNFHVGLDQALLEGGFAVVNINHRSSRDAVWPAQIQDVKAAIRYIRANAATFSLDSSFIGITGFSSGGHLSSMAGVTSHTKTDKINGLDIDLEGSLGKFTTTSSHVDAVVDFFGPSNFLTMDECAGESFHDDAKSPESTLVGGALQENKDKVALANPMSYITKNDPPFLIFHGNKDPMVPLCQSELLFEKLQKNGINSKLVIVENGGHGPLVFVENNFQIMNAFFKEVQAKRKNTTQKTTESPNDRDDIKNLIVRYKESINAADTILGAKVWANTPEVSFIHPRGHEKGWKGVKDGFYGMFRNMFATRDLKSNDETINIYGDVAWVEFYWVYDATFKDGKPMQSKGRETQVLKKINNEWRLA